MSHIVSINRRTFLKGAGALVALPFLESLALPTDNRAAPRRFCFFYVPNGMSMEDWRPKRTGPLGKSGLPAILGPLVDHLDYITVASGLDNRASEKGGRTEVLGQHARSIGAFLSGAYPSTDLRAGETIDIALARSLQGGAGIPILNLATEYAEDEHDVGYSPVYNYSLSWKNEHTPVQPILSLDYAFGLLCGDSRSGAEVEAGVRARRLAKMSVLDTVRESGKVLEKGVSDGDRAGLEEYYESVRSVEQELDAAAAGPPAACADEAQQYEGHKSFEERLKLMLDLVVLALRTNSTRVATLLFGAERSERDFGFLTARAGIDMSGGHHSISHHKNNAKQIRKYVQISTFHTQHLARFLHRLKAIREGEGNLLDHTMILYGSSMADGNSHEHGNLPILIAGKGNGLIDPGSQGFHVHYGGKPISNLYLTLLQKTSAADAGGNVYSSFGDSGGTLHLPGGL